MKVLRIIAIILVFVSGAFILACGEQKIASLEGNEDITAVIQRLPECYENPKTVMEIYAEDAVFRRQDPTTGKWNEFKGLKEIEDFKKVQRSVKPEFLNRIDEVILFKPLGFDEIMSIVKRELNKVVKNIHEFGYKLQFSEEVNDYLAHEGFDPVYGARPLRRAIQRSVENPLSKAILAKSFKKGATIKAEIEKGRIAFR